MREWKVDGGGVIHQLVPGMLLLFLAMLAHLHELRPN